MLFSFLFVAIERPEMESRTKQEIVIKYKDMMIFPSESVWTNTTKDDKCGFGTYDSETDYKYALSVLNFARWLAGFNKEVKGNKDYINEQLACAINNKLNGGINNHPAPDSECYSEEAKSGCENSNLAWDSFKSNSAHDIKMHLSDTSVSNVEHRSWCLYQGLTQVSFGRIDTFGAMRVKGFNSQGGETPSFFGWPAPGPFPQNLMKDQGPFKFIWSFHVKQFETEQPIVEIFEGGKKIGLDPEVAVSKEKNELRYELITFKPEGKVKLDTTYTVIVKDGSKEYKYKVTPFDISKVPIPNPVDSTTITIIISVVIVVVIIAICLGTYFYVKKYKSEND